MKKVIIDRTKIESIDIERLYLFIDDNNQIIVLPSLWATHIIVTESTYRYSVIKNSIGSNTRQNAFIEIQSEFKSFDINDITAKIYIGHVHNFLVHINKNPNLSVHNTESIHTNYINDYLNKILCKNPDITQLSTIQSHKIAIESYCNFLCAIGVWNYKENRLSTIFSNTKKSIQNKPRRPRKIKYLTLNDRRMILSRCTNKRDKLIIKMGAYVGLRCKELTGLKLKDSPNISGKSARLGLISLFDELEKQPEKIKFKYQLIETKGGKERTIYFSRELLEEIKDYYDNERKLYDPENCTNELFVRMDRGNEGRAIGIGFASDLFNKLLAQISHMLDLYSFHDLRHSFATDLYHEQLKNECAGNSSAARMAVGERLGHSPGKEGNYPATAIYVRLLIVKEELESI